MAKSTNERLVDALLRDYHSRLQAGERLDRAALVAEHPLLAPRLQRALEDLGDWGSGPRAEGDMPAEAEELSLPKLPGLAWRGELGSGAMGRVVAAVDGAGQSVAVKLLHPSLAPGSAQARRLEREVRAVQQLDHPHIVPVLDSGVSEATPYIVMPLIDDGCHLGRRLAAGPLEPREAATLLAPVAEALQFAHERNIIHRDIKPGNILLDGDHAWLTDFGLAHLADETLSRMTKTGEMVGTIAYMAPEQALGDSKPDPAWDIYGLGATLYECLAGRPPYVGGGPSELLAQLASREPLPVNRRRPAIPAPLTAICMTAIARDPADRYATAGAFAADLRSWLAGEGLRTSARWWRWRRWRTLVLQRRRVVLAAMLGVVALGLFGLQIQRFRYQSRTNQLVRSQGHPTAREVDNVGFLLRAVTDDDPEVRAAAASALLRHRNEPGVRQTLLQVARDADGMVRFRLAQELLTIDDPWRREVASVLLRAADGGPAAAAAVRLASELDDPELTARIGELAYSDDRVTRQYVLGALVHLLGEDFQSFAREYLETGPVGGRLELLSRLDTRHAPPPLATLVALAAGNDQPEDLRAACVDLLRLYLGDRAAVPADWMEWWAAQGPDVRLQRCRVVTWARPGTLLRRGDIIWSASDAVPPDNTVKRVHLKVFRDGRFRRLPATLVTEEHRLDNLYFALLDGLPVGVHPAVPALRAALVAAKDEGNE